MRAEFQRAMTIVLLQQIRIDKPIVGRERCAGNSLELVDLGHSAIHLGWREGLDRMAKFALQRQMLDSARISLLVVKPQITFLAEADLVANALVVFDRRAA